MIISVATNNQLPIIRDLAFKIWPVAYDEILSNEQLNYMLDLIYSIESLEKQVEKSHVFLLVKENNNYIGFASYELNYKEKNEIPVEKKLNLNKTKIQKLYVLPEIQRKGIGKHLINYIKQIAIANDNSVLILNVNRFNKAKDFYIKQGFTIVSKVKIDIGNNYIMDDYVMELTL
ncbi:GNAT family N-acetyltransferase [Flavobacterium sp.]|uniref:GNAT family N-acetyltransferase n=1 Tax=Flavobacterium sp. TaxID=239 RepID=UPI0037524968